MFYKIQDGLTCDLMNELQNWLECTDVPTRALKKRQYYKSIVSGFVELLTFSLCFVIGDPVFHLTGDVKVVIPQYQSRRLLLLTFFRLNLVNQVGSTS